jgi:hypothetical protein
MLLPHLSEPAISWSIILNIHAVIDANEADAVGRWPFRSAKDVGYVQPAKQPVAAYFDAADLPKVRQSMYLLITPRLII